MRYMISYYLSIHSCRHFLFPLSISMHLYDLHGFFLPIFFCLWRLCITNFSEPDLKQHGFPFPQHTQVTCIYGTRLLLICTFLSVSSFVLCILTPNPFHSHLSFCLLRDSPYSWLMAAFSSEKPPW